MITGALYLVIYLWDGAGFYGACRFYFDLRYLYTGHKISVGSRGYSCLPLPIQGSTYLIPNM